MKITCLQEKLKKAINLVEKITGKNINLPILNNILLETDKGRLKVSATDLEIAINLWLTAKIEKGGKVTIPAAILSNFIGSLPHEKVYLETEKQNLLVKCENFQAQIKGLNPDDFPIIPKIGGEKLFSLRANDLQKSLTQVYSAASFSDTRPEISGVLFKISRDEVLKLVATDSFRLAEKTIKKVGQIQKEIDFIIPLKAIIELIRILSETDQEVNILIQDNQILFNLNNEIHLISRLIEGHFPDYERIVPHDFKTEVLVERDKLIEAIRIASLFAGKTNDVSFNFSSLSKIEVSSASQELGSHNSILKADVKGDDIKLTFNYKYVLDGLNNIDGSKVVLLMNGKEKPLLMKPADKKDYLYLVMPVRDTD